MQSVTSLENNNIACFVALGKLDVDLCGQSKSKVWE